jgi:excisionase family DNA binding protein
VVREGKELTTREAAELLGVNPQRVRALAAQGRLGARRTGTGWMIPVEAIKQRNKQELRGRPVSADTAWALITALSAGELTPAAVPDYRLRHRIAKLIDTLPDPVVSPDPWQTNLTQRHTVRRVWIHADLRTSLRNDLRVSVGGLPELDDGERLHLYAQSVQVLGLEAEYRMRDDPDGGVLLHAVPDSVVRPFAPVGGRPAPRAAGAADLLDTGSEAQRQAAIDVIHNMWASLRAR